MTSIRHGYSTRADEEVEYGLSRAFQLFVDDAGILVDGGPSLCRLDSALAVTLLPAVLHLLLRPQKKRDFLSQVQEQSRDDAGVLWEQLRGLGLITVWPSKQSAGELFIQRAHFGRLLERHAAALTKNILICYSSADMVLSSLLRQQLIDNGLSSQTVLTRNTDVVEQSDEGQFDLIVFINVVDPTTDCEVVTALGVLASCETDAMQAVILPFSRESVGIHACRKASRECRCPSPLTAAAWASHLASMVTLHCLGLRYFIPGIVTTTDLVSLQSHSQVAVNLRGGSTHELHVDRQLSASYEALLSAQRQTVSSGIRLRLTLPDRNLLNSPMLRLPPAIDLSQSAIAALAGYASSSSEPLNARVVGSLCAYISGYLDAHPTARRRWTPTAGNKGSVHVFVVSRGVQGIKDGIYQYENSRHGMVPLDSLRKIELQASVDPAQPSIRIILVGSYARLARKYGIFAYKLLFLDIGIALSQLIVAAQALGLTVTQAKTIDRLMLCEQLRLRSDIEMPVHVVDISSPECESSVRPTSSPPPYPKAEVLSQREVMLVLWQRYMHRQELIDMRVHASYAALFLARMLAIFKPAQFRKSLSQTLTERRSVRHFRQSGLSRMRLECICRLSLLPNVLVRSRIQLLVVARSVGSRVPLVYVVDENTLSFRKHCEMPDSETLREIFTDTSSGYHLSPAILIYIGSERFNGQTDENPRYEDQLLAAALLTHRMAVAAQALGVSGTIVAGVNAAKCRAAFRLTPRQTVQVAYACGLDASCAEE